MTSSEWHFPAETVTFINDLKTNNNREWFQANKAVFEEAYKKPAEFFANMMSEQMAGRFGGNFTPKVFRIYRDVRFSKDKTPYNTQLHISFSPVGGGMPAYFFGLETDRLVLGAGSFGFTGDTLIRYQQDILGDRGAALEGVSSGLLAAGYRLSEPALKRVPRGMPVDHPRADLLRYKGFAAWFDFPDTAAATSDGLVETCLNRFAELKPLVDWLAGLN